MIAVLLLCWPARASAQGDVIVQLFEWRWTDIAEECEQFLGPKGFDAVQISPPNEHIDYHAWWARYQPVSYLLESRSGTRAQLVDMVRRCNAAGVRIYADLVFNHTAVWNGGGVGVAGTPWAYMQHNRYPVYQPRNYHPVCPIRDYGNLFQVQNCELLGLPDLNTAQPYVQEQIATYIQDLRRIGVAGFRIDAAKHMPPADIAEILRMAGTPYAYQEVIGAPGEAVRPAWYTPIGPVTEFDYARTLGYQFIYGDVGALRNIEAGKLPSEDAIVFVDNHDIQRGHGAAGTILTYENGSRYNIANVFMLAYPYGTPKIMSSYDFTDPNAGPPPGGGCDGTGFVCEHRWTSIANMVAFRQVTDGTPVRNWWSSGTGQIAFSRGNRGFVAINNTRQPMNASLQTGLPPGAYCNIAAGDFIEGRCTGPVIAVTAGGRATVNISPHEAAAIHVAAMLPPTARAPQNIRAPALRNVRKGEYQPVFSVQRATNALHRKEKTRSLLGKHHDA